MNRGVTGRVKRAMRTMNFVRILHSLLSPSSRHAIQISTRKTSRPGTRYLSSATFEQLETRTVFAAFTPGNLAIFRIGDGSAPLAANGNVVFADEYTPQGTLVQSINLSTVGGSNFVTTGTSTAEGNMSLSKDGQFLVMPGYNVAQGSLVVNSSTRVVGLVGVDGNVDLSTRGTFNSGGNFRGATMDGNNIWTVGSSGGIAVISKGQTTGAGTQLSTTVTNLRTVNIFNNQLYISTQSGAFRLGTVGTGQPTTNGQTITNLAGFPTSTGSPYQFFFARLGTGTAFNGYDTLYVADDAGGGIQKFSFNGTAWTQTGSATAGSIRGLTGVVTGTTVTLFGTNGTTLYTLTDTAGFNANPSSTAASTLRTAGTNLAWRGISSVPDDGIGSVAGMAGTTNYTAGAAATIVSSTGTFADLSNFKGGSLSIEYVSGGTANDTLSITSVGTAAGQIGFDGTTITYEGTAIGTLNATLNGVNGTTLRVNFNDVTSANSVSAAAVQALMRQINFSTTSGASAGNRIVTFKVAQNDGKTSSVLPAAQQTISVTASAGANQSPVFGTTGPFSIAENSPTATAVGTVTATDPDVGQSLTFAANGNGTGASLFDMSTTGQITVRSGAVLNFEGTNSFTFGVQVSDNGSPVQTTSTNVTITLTNVNEAPVFPASAITRSVVAGSASGTATVGGAVAATDPDAGDSVASYQIVGGNGTGGGAFAINNSGVISVADAAQITSTGIFTLQVTATDTFGLPSAPKDVTINVIVNNDPVFNPDVYTFTVAENSGNNTIVGTPLAATDADTGAGDVIAYSITAGNGTGGGAFKISATGQISVNDVAQINFEATTSFALTVRATDSFGRFDTATVTIDVTNVVETPTIPAGQTFTLVENSASGTVVGTVLATFDATATKSFSITAGNGTGSGAFAIDNTGVITIADAAQINYEAVINHVFNLTVAATDTANTLTGTRTVSVSLSNLQEGTVLLPGDVMITGFDSSGTDEFSFVPLVNLAANSEIRFTDNGWFAAGGFRANEGKVVYVAPAGGVSAGTRIGITSDGAGAVAVVSGPGTAFNETGGTTFSFNTSGDQLIAFQGTIAAPTPLFALTTNRSTFDADATSATATALPTGLTLGSTAIALGGTSAGTSNAQYNDTVLAGTAAEIASAVANPLNWTTSATRITLTYFAFNSTIVSIGVNGGDTFLNANQRSQITSVLVTLTAPVPNIATALTLTNIGLYASQSVPIAAAQLQITDLGNGVYSIRFGAGPGVISRSGTGAAGNSLADGNYVLALNATQVRGNATFGNDFGDRAADSFFRMFGDSDGDGDVDSLDLIAMRRAALLAASAANPYNAALDFNGDGINFGQGIDSSFTANYGKRRRVLP